MRIGIIGGGQLARMLILAGKPMGLDFAVLTPMVYETTKNLATHYLSELEWNSTTADFVADCDVITFENENIPAELLQRIAGQKPLHPNPELLRHSQDRLKEKQLFERLGIPTNDFMPVSNPEELAAAVTRLGYPLLLKARRFGYDGKHQYRIQNAAQLASFQQQYNLSWDFLAEEIIEFSREVSQIIVRDVSGHIRFYDLCENEHKYGILRATENKPNDTLASICRHYLQQLSEAFAVVGALTVEFFVKDNRLLANEIAPRVHNSGHWTIEGTLTSQFANHCRAIAGLPLGDPTSLGRCRMNNFIGTLPEPQAILKKPNCYYHAYQKDPRPDRKLGHMTTVLLAE